MYPALEQVSADLDIAAKHLVLCFRIVTWFILAWLTRWTVLKRPRQFRNAQVGPLDHCRHLSASFITMRAINKCTARPLVILFDTQSGDNVNPLDNYVATMRNSALIAITQPPATSGK